MDKDELTGLVIGNKILYLYMAGNVIPISSDQVIEIDDPVPEGNRWRSIALHYRADEGRTSWVWAPAGTWPDCGQHDEGPGTDTGGLSWDTIGSGSACSGGKLKIWAKDW